MHSMGLSMLEAMEDAERKGLFAPDSPLLKSEEFSEMRADLSLLADAMSLRSPDFVRRVKALFKRLGTE